MVWGLSSLFPLPAASFSQGGMDPRLMLRCVLTLPALGTVVALAGSREAWLGSALALSPLCQLYLFQVP